jgi:hypothetical protein
MEGKEPAMDGYKLQVELGNAKFSGEGDQKFVEDAYKRFLEAIAASAAQPPSLTSEYAKRHEQPPAGLNQSLLQKAFLREDQLVSLRHLPPTDNSTRAADAAILLLYGFKKILGAEDVLVTRLNEGLRKSGLTLTRIDTILGIHSALYRKGGQRSGGRYSLSNPGEAQAEKWLNEWYS